MGQCNSESKSTPAAAAAAEGPEPAPSRARRLPAAAPAKSARGGGETSPARSITAPASARGMTAPLSAVRSTTGSGTFAAYSAQGRKTSYSGCAHEDGQPPRAAALLLRTALRGERQVIRAALTKMANAVMRAKSGRGFSSDDFRWIFVSFAAQTTQNGALLLVRTFLLSERIGHRARCLSKCPACSCSFVDLLAPALVDSGICASLNTARWLACRLLPRPPLSLLAGLS
jgi:hypothetical protein